MNLSRSDLLEILEIARWAPSVHNTQPWKVTAEGDMITVEIDKTHKLVDGDPTGRETIISLGIFCEAISIGCAHSGKKVESMSLQTDGAKIRVAESGQEQTTAEKVKLLESRSTDRSIYKPAEISAEMVSDLKACADGLEVTVEVSAGKPVIEKVADLTSKGIALSLSSPSFRKELSNYLVLPNSNSKRGINVKSLYLPGFITWFEPWLVKSGLVRGFERDMEKKRWASASALIMVTALGDLHKYWFDTGRAYLRLSLTIEKHGLSQATSAAIVEASNYHDDIEDMLGTKLRILALMRVGQGKKRRYQSPRLSAEDLAT